MQHVGLGVAAVLGLLQGLTEFLPVSSSGHIAVGALFFGVKDMPLSMVVVLHAGTLMATLWIFAGDVGQLAREAAMGLRTPKAFLASDQGRIVVGVIVASVPTAIMGLLLETRVEGLSHHASAVGGFLLATAVVVASTRWGRGTLGVLPLWGYLLIGIAQGCAVMPGLSRSGTTIAVAMWLGLSGPQAFRFSFLLSLPAVFGALVLKLSEPAVLAELGWPAIVGGVVALVVGYAALRLLREVVKQGRFWAFAIYLVPLGLGLIAWDFAS